MKKMLKWVGIIVVALIVAVVAARSVLIKNAAQKAISKMTGFDLKVGGISVGIVSPEFEIRDLKLTNPPDFPDAEAFDVKQVYVKYDLMSFFGNNPHLYKIVIDIPKAVVVKKADGETNLERLEKASKQAGGGEGKAEGKKGEKKPEAKPAPGEEKPAPQVRIDLLTLKLGTVEVRDYSRGGEKPEVFTYDLNVDRTFENVTELNVISTVIAAEILNNVGGKLIQDMGKIMEQNQGDLKKTGKELEKNFKGLLKGFKAPKTP